MTDRTGFQMVPLVPLVPLVLVEHAVTVSDVKLQDVAQIASGDGVKLCFDTFLGDHGEEAQSTCQLESEVRHVPPQTAIPWLVERSTGQQALVVLHYSVETQCSEFMLCCVIEDTDRL